jgi:hypothetical protein
MPRSSKHFLPLGLCLGSALLLCACGGGGSAAPVTDPTSQTIHFDCTDGPSCPAININGDPLYVLPNGASSPFRGFADPSMRKDPDSARLWLSYSYVSIHPDLVAGNVVITPSVEIHLAHSDDRGQSWTYDKTIWPSTLGTDQGATNDVGYSIHEVSTLAPFHLNNTTQWFALHLRYFLKQGDPIDLRKGDSFQHRLTSAATPTQLGNNAEAILTNPLTAPGWGSNLQLATLSPDLSKCSVFSEPSLYQVDDKLYFITECLVLDLSSGNAVRVPSEEFNAVFVTDVGSDVTKFNWQYLGKITDSSVAAELGGIILTQVDIARGRDGKLLLIVTPATQIGNATQSHLGCRVLEIASLNPPALARNSDGSLKLRADIRSSDSDSSGLCSYDPDADTGVILVRTHVDLTKPELVWQMHATGVQP